MNKKQLQDRTKSYGLAVIFLCRALPDDLEFRVIRRQAVRSSTSVGANYRAACRARSDADFINKLKIVEEELDETQYWLEMIVALRPEIRESVIPVYKEGDELIAIVVASINTTRKRKKSSQPLKQKQSLKGKKFLKAIRKCPEPQNLKS